MSIGTTMLQGKNQPGHVGLQGVTDRFAYVQVLSSPQA
jgi:hypothetical protein